MNNDEKIKLLESGDYFLYAHIIDNKWYFPDDQKVISYIKSVVIHKKDKEVADAVIANSDARAEWLNPHIGFNQRRENGDDFFLRYNHELKYRLKPQKQLKQICDNPDVNALHINNMEDLNNLPLAGEEDVGNNADNTIAMDSNSSIATERKSSNMDERMVKETIGIIDKIFIEREFFIARVSSIIGIAYSGGKINIRLKNNGYIQLQMSKKEFADIVIEYKLKAYK